MGAVIGIMPLYDAEKASLWMLPGYVELVEKNGGIPVILPLTTNPEVLDYFIHLCDGFLFTGGQDVDPELYGAAKKTTCGEICTKRDQMERYCLEAIIALDKPVLAICRGLQIINSVLGGTLYQDLPTEINSTICHQMTAPYHRKQHEVTLVKESLLFDLLQKESLAVNSYHHQGIKQLSPQLAVAAIAEDGLVEAAYLPKCSFVLAVQWHPEFFDAETEVNRRLMQGFLRHAKSSKKR